MAPKKTTPVAAPPQKKEEPKSPPQAVVSQPTVPQKVSLGRRKSDCFFIIAYLVWAVVAFVLFLANCERLLPKEVNEIPFREPICQALDNIEGPLRPLLESHQQWGKKMFSTQADFALDVVYFVNLFFVAPFAVLLALGFLAGLHFVKNWAIIHATVMFYNMVIIDIYAYEALKLFDVLDLENVALGAFIIYGFFTIFPLVVLKRVWGNAPFIQAKAKRGFLARAVVFLIKQVLFLWLLLAVVGFYEFTVKHTVSLKHLPSVVDTGKEGWEKAGPLRDEFLVKAAEFQEFAGQKLVEGVAATKVLAADIGEQVVTWVQSKREQRKEEAPKKEAAAEQPKKPAEQKAKKAPPPKPKATPKSEPPPPKPQAPPAPKPEAPKPPPAETPKPRPPAEQPKPQPPPQEPPAPQPPAPQPPTPPPVQDAPAAQNVPVEVSDEL